MDQVKDESEEEFFKRHRARIHVVEDGVIPDLDNDPVFLKKKEDGFKALQECPIPEWLIKRINER